MLFLCILEEKYYSTLRFYNLVVHNIDYINTYSRIFETCKHDIRVFEKTTPWSLSLPRPPNFGLQLSWVLGID
jgi:hypothetical protein